MAYASLSKPVIHFNNLYYCLTHTSEYCPCAAAERERVTREARENVRRMLALGPGFYLSVATILGAWAAVFYLGVL